MSSAASSSSSKLSQFGLYRAIDARTEEFLRLSRRRQIRQGCACAAVSTAITVTVVITVVLVYEFTINFDSGFEKQTRQDWLDSYNNNNSVYHPSSKSKAEIESLNAKILPVIAKIFNKGEIPMRKNVEQGIKKNVKQTQTQTSTPSSISDKMRRSDTPFEKLFWSKMSPSQNTYTDPKSPPSMVNFKNQLNNLDYYRKIRNIKNYQRMLGYFDKMISNPLTLPSTRGLMKSQSEPLIYGSSTEKSSHIQSMRKKSNKANTIQVNPLFTTLSGKASEKSSTASDGDKITNIIYLRTTPGTTLVESSLIATTIAKNENNKTCDCDSQLLYLLRSLVTNIQDLLPKLKLYKASCSNDMQDNISHKEFETDVDSQDNHSILKGIVPHGTIVNDTTAINETQKENSSNTTRLNDLSQKLNVFKTENNITHHNYTIVFPENLTKYVLNDSDTIKSYTKSATPEETSVKVITESVSSTIDLKEEDIVSALNEGFNDSFSNNNATNTTNDELSKLDVSNFDAIFNFSKLEDDNSTVENTEILSNVRPYTNVSHHNNITVTSLLITQRSKDKGNQSTENGELENDLNILDDFNFDKKLKLIYSQSYPVWTESEDEVEQRKSSEIYDSFNLTNHVDKLKTRATLLDLFGKTSSKVLKQPVSAKKLDNMRIYNRKDDSRPHAMEYDEFQFLNEEQKEQNENSVLFENNAIKFDKYDTTMRKASNLDDSTSYVKSMLPVSRPIYLEVQRNDWKHENDYVTMDNIFELL